MKAVDGFRWCQVGFALVAFACVNNDNGTDAGADTGSAADVATAERSQTETRDSIAFDITADRSEPDSAPAVSAACRNYCTAIMANCTGTNKQYPDNARCLAVCSHSAGFAAGTTGDTTSNTVACRSHYATQATQDPAINCPRAGAQGGNTCGSWCDVYCYLEDRNCEGTLASIHPSIEKCQAACVSLPKDGKPGDTAGNSVQCRMTFLIEAGDNAELAKEACDSALELCR